jgi:NDP-sugar pyrophosphorylase family protein
MTEDITKPSYYFDLTKFPHSKIFDGCNHIWEVLGKIEKYIKKNIKKSIILGKVSKHARIEGKVYIGRGTIIEPNVFIKGPAIIGDNCEIRHNAYFRENVIIGNNVVIGNSCEIKNSIVFNDATIPHLSYVGDSIIGWKVHLGAGVITSNVKLRKDTIFVKINGKKYDTKLKKFGAIIGDETEVGCNTTFNPGSLIGKKCLIYPNVLFGGVLKSNSCLKLIQQHEIIT